MFRRSEYLLIFYFLLRAAWIAARGSFRYSLAALSVPAILWILAALDRRNSRKWISILRDWIPLPLVLLAYLSADWVLRGVASHGYEARWIVWDRFLLEGLRLHAAVESLGPVFPTLLEFCYLFLYAIPSVVLIVLYLAGRRAQVDRFLVVLLAGTLTANALLPLFPTTTPRIAFPGQDLPSMLTTFRRINLWILDSFDIQGSVFPSGHVAMAFSTAFGAMLVLPDRPWLVRLLFVFAFLVTINTVYARYHYAADAVASILISILAFRVSRILEP